ncbi:MAG: bifunctional UDP-N-acetylglucosamine diphosphorylase/glucosamine-1-phosphate N-acetyltransferase GlmU [Rhodospirillaceae bacterium]|nr:bifunctional UDP-N-acetylglucosamine diphosphorylase/glucosamine-1-phosphate N-acetyltransferase GlmU [Rhodospirillaceae bacterium]
MTTGACAAIVLAAGMGTRMKSDLPKVLHRVANRPMISHLLDALSVISSERTVVVVAPGMTQLVDAVAPADTAVQTEALGTGHAVLAARDQMQDFTGDVLVLFGDTPLLTAQTMQDMLTARRAAENPAVVVLGFRPDDPAEYGRLVTAADGGLEAIVEFKDASDAQREIGLCNAGIMAIDGNHLFALLDAVGNDNANGEYYLTDIVELARDRGLRCAVVEAADPVEVMGVNSRAQLAEAEAAMQARLRDRAMAGGVTMTDPETVWLSADTKIGRDVIIGPNVFFGTGVTIADNVEIKAFCHIDGAEVASGVSIGPFARLRPGSKLERNVHVGNFVEIKQALVEEGAKVNHLSYVGDARIGPRANVGAGTITCNYDGFFKELTDIGADAFIGSNTALVAPVKVGDGATVGAGSVITSDVEADALAVARGRQKSIAGWASAFRKRRKAEKDAAKAKK